MTAVPRAATSLIRAVAATSDSGHRRGFHPWTVFPYLDIHRLTAGGALRSANNTVLR